MTDHRTDTSPRRGRRASIDGAVLRSLLRLRIVLALVVALLHVRNTLSGDVGGVIACSTAAAILLTSLTEPLARRTFSAVRASVTMVAIDTALVLIALGANDVSPGDPASLLLALPIIEAGVRHGMFGSVVTGGAISLALFGHLAVTWDGTPGQADDPLKLALVLMAVALPAAHVSEHVAARLRALEAARSTAQHRADTLAEVLRETATIVATPAADRASAFAGAVKRVTGFSVVHPADSTSSECEPIEIPLDAAGSHTIAITGDRGTLDRMALDAIQLLAAASKLSTVQTADAAADTTLPVEHRAAAIESLEHQLAQRGPDQVSIALVSLDNLKLLNDLHDREVGDRLIAATIQRLATIGNDSTAIARLAGDEFVVTVDGPLDRRQLARALDGAVDLGVAGSTFVHCGIGIATAHDPALPITAEQLLRAATEDMYDDKRAQNAAFLDEVTRELSSTPSEATS